MTVTVFSSEEAVALSSPFDWRPLKAYRDPDCTASPITNMNTPVFFLDGGTATLKFYVKNEGDYPLEMDWAAQSEYEMTIEGPQWLKAGQIGKVKIQAKGVPQGTEIIQYTLSCGVIIG
jgi:archaellum component FlaG (FlaF/FlaG flagellin family)